MKIFQKVQGNLATNLYVTSNNKTASVKKADSDFDSDLDSDLELPDSDGLWLDKYDGLWEVCADEAMMIHDSSSAWGLDDDLEVVPLEQLGEFAPFRRAKLKAVGRKANASAFASKPVASVDVTLTRMNVKTGSERLLKSFKTSSADEALRLAEKQFGKMAEVKIARGLHSAGAYDKASRRSAAGRHSDTDTGSFQFTIDTPANVDVKYDNTPSGPTLTFFGNVDDLEAVYDDVIEPIVGVSWQEYAYDWNMLDTNDKHDSDESTPRHKASIRSAARSFKTARRKLSMQEKLRLIDEDRLEDDDFDL